MDGSGLIIVKHQNAVTSAENLVLALHKSAYISGRLEVPKPDVARKGSEQWDPFSDQHRNPGDHEPLDESVAQESLNGDAAINVGMLGAGCFKPADDFAR